jgi:hypothetical protein
MGAGVYLYDRQRNGGNACEHAVPMTRIEIFTVRF